MNAIAFGSLIVFLLAWLAGVAAWSVGAYHLFRWWIDRAKGQSGRHHIKALKAMGVFLGCWAIAMLAGIVGFWWGPWSTT